jgi:hypothetical protein
MFLAGAVPASCEASRYCATDTYAVATGESSGGIRLWWIPYPAEASAAPTVMEASLEGVPTTLTCGGDAVYLRQGAKWFMAQPKDTTLVLTPAAIAHTISSCTRGMCKFGARELLTNLVARRSIR